MSHAAGRRQASLGTPVPRTPTVILISSRTIKQDVGYYLHQEGRTWVKHRVPCLLLPSALDTQFGTPYPRSAGFDTDTVDYVTMWVDAIPTSSAYHSISIKMLKEVIFPRFGVPRYLMTDGGSHFIHGAFHKILAKYDVNHRLHHPIILSLVVKLNLAIEK